MRTGANDLWMAYAMINWLAPATIFVFSSAFDTPIHSIHCWTSTPFEMKKYIVPNEISEIPTWKTINTEPYSLTAFFSFSRGVAADDFSWHDRVKHKLGEYRTNRSVERAGCCVRHCCVIWANLCVEKLSWARLLNGRITFENDVKILNIVQPSNTHPESLAWSSTTIAFSNYDLKRNW